MGDSDFNSDELVTSTKLGTRWSLWALGISLLVFVAVIAFSIHQRISEGRTLMAQIWQGRKVAIGLRLFASSCSGNYPLRLEDLLRFDCLEDKTLLNVCVGAGQPTKPWHFYWNLDDSSHPDLLLLVSPVIEIRPDFIDRIWHLLSGSPLRPDVPHRIIVRNSSIVECKTEPEFRKMLTTVHIDFPPQPAPPEPKGFYDWMTKGTK